MKKGFTLIEVIIVTAVILVVSSIILRSYARFNSAITIRSEVGRITSIIYKAKSDSMAGLGDTQHGVHFESDRAVAFRGDTYTVGLPDNEEHPLQENVSISNISLSGGGNNIVFDRLTGTTLNAGSILVSISGIGATSTEIGVSVGGVITTR